MEIYKSKSNFGWSDFTLLIMTRDRPEMISECVESAKSMLGKIVISDNSIHHYEYNFPSYVEIIYRGGMLSGTDHFNLCVTGVTTKHFCIFHDDDIFIAEEFSRYIEFALKHPAAVAVTANAYRVTHRDGYTNPLPMIGKKIKVVNSDFLRTTYLSPLNFGIPPFPVYIYNRSITNNLLLKSEHGGKFCDASLIFDISKITDIPIYSRPVMFYRLTGGNDQMTFRVSDYKRMYNHLMGNLRKNLNPMNLYRLSRFYFLNKPRKVFGVLKIKLFLNMCLYYLFRGISKVFNGY